MKLACLPALLLITCLTAFPAITRAAMSATESAAHWLQVELPAKVSLQSADCEQLTAAVGRATLAHQPEAPAILRVALTRGTKPLKRGEGGKLPSGCAERMFSVSVAAAPTQASALLDLAMELYPDRAADLAGMMRDYDRVAYDYKDRVGDKNVAGGGNAPARGTTTVPSDPSDPGQPSFAGITAQNPGDLSAQDISAMGFGDANGFGNGGISEGFPGSPSFVGSPPDGGLALPPTAVTAAVNS